MESNTINGVEATTKEINDITGGLKQEVLMELCIALKKLSLIMEKCDIHFMEISNIIIEEGKDVEIENINYR